MSPTLTPEQDFNLLRAVLGKVDEVGPEPYTAVIDTWLGVVLDLCEEKTIDGTVVNQLSLAKSDEHPQAVAIARYLPADLELRDIGHVAGYFIFRPEGHALSVHPHGDRAPITQQEADMLLEDMETSTPVK